MKVLPIKAIRNDDLFDKNIIQLAYLRHLGFPVADGFVISPPEDDFLRILKKHSVNSIEEFEGKRGFLLKELLGILIPGELETLLKPYSLDAQRVWGDLLGLWLDELRLRISKGVGFIGLSYQPVFISNGMCVSGVAYVDPKREVLIKAEQGSLTVEQSLKLEELVKKASKKVLLPYVYHWIVESTGDVSFVKLSPFTDYPYEAKEVKFLEDKRIKDVVKSGVKVFQDVSNTLTLLPDTDGLVVVSGKIDGFDEKVFKLVESAASVRGHVFYCIDAEESDLREEAKVFLFSRNKKSQLNTQVVIENIKSASQLLEVKRELAVNGITRKGSLKFWMEVGFPENALNIDKYIDVGVDGVLVNTDKLFEQLVGKKLGGPEEVGILTDFLKPFFSKLHKFGILIIVSGKISTNEDFLHFIIKSGVYGLVTDLPVNQNPKDHISYISSRFLFK